MDVNSVLQNTRQYFQGVPSSSPQTGELAPGASVGYGSPPVSSTAATSTATSAATNPFPAYQQPPQGFPPPPASALAASHREQQQLPPQWSSSTPSPTALSSAAIAPHNAPVATAGYRSTTPSQAGGYPRPAGGGGSSAATSSVAAPPPSSVAAYARNYSPAVTSVGAPYHMYENSAAAARAAPPAANSKAPLASMSTFELRQHYTAPSITRLKEGCSQGMYSMDSIVCQPNVNNHVQGKKSSKIRMTALTTTTSLSSSSSSTSSLVNVYKQSAVAPTEESRFCNNNRLAPPPPSASQASRIPLAVGLSSHHQQQRPTEPPPSPANHHPGYPSRGQLPEQRVGVGYQQQQASYHTVRATSIEKVSQRDPVDLQYYNYRRIETAAIEGAPPQSLPPPPVVSKRDSPLDLSVKTIRQSADSTAHDDAENAAAAAAAAFGQHFPLGAHPPLRLEGRHPHLPQLPYPAVALPGGRNHSTGTAAAFNGTAQSRQTTHYSSTAAAVAAAAAVTNTLPTVAGYPEASPYALKNGQLHDDLQRHHAHPVSEFRNEQMTVSITYEQKQQTHRTQVNAQISSMQYSHYYRHPPPPPAVVEPPAKGRGQRPLPPLLTEQNVTNHVLPAETTNHVPASRLPMTAAAAAAYPRKRRPPVAESPVPPPKTPRVSTEWRQRFDKEIENRLNEYTSKKAREEEEKLQLASKSRLGHGEDDNNGYRAVATPSPLPLPDKRLASLDHADGEQPKPSPSAGYMQQQQQTPLPSQQQQQPLHSPKLPFTRYLEQQQQQQKAQHKLPVQPIQMHHHHQREHHHASSQAWSAGPPYQRVAQPPHAFGGSPYKALPTFGDAPPHPMFGGRPSFDAIGGAAGDLKVVRKSDSPKLSPADAHEQRPLPPFQAIPLKMNFPPQLTSSASASSAPAGADERLQEMRPDDAKSAEKEFLRTKEQMEEHQARAALMASALTHPRIRTKAELKQVAPVDKSKDKAAAAAAAAVVDKLSESVQDVGKSCSSGGRSQYDGGDYPRRSETCAPGISNNNSESKLGVIDDAVYNHRPGSGSAPINAIGETENPIMAVSAALLSSACADVAGKQYSPRKRLFSKSEESSGGDVKRSSSETTVFEFRDSDSEPETFSTDLHSLNEMRKDRKTLRTPSATSTIIDQLNEEPIDDSNWLEACDELIQQFESGGRSMTRSSGGRKTKSSAGEDSDTPVKQPIKQETLDSADEATDEGTDEAMDATADGHETPTPPNIKQERVHADVDVSPPSPAAAHLKTETESSPPPPLPASKSIVEPKSEERRLRDQRAEERRTRDAERERKTEKQSSETRGQRSNVSTTRIRIQNMFERASSESESESGSESRDSDDEDFEEEMAPKKTSGPPAAKTPAKSPAKKPSVRPPPPPSPPPSAGKKKKALLPQPPPKPLRKKSKVVSKKLQKVDVKREKMRHMILRRIETRKSKLEAMKNLRKSKKCESASASSEDMHQPIMTRKMARRECQKDSRRGDEPAKKKPVAALVQSGRGRDAKKAKEPAERSEKPKAKEQAERSEKPKAKETERPERPETRMHKFEKMKMNGEKPAKRSSERETRNEKVKAEDVTRRTLRSRNVVVVNDKHPRKLKKKEESGGGGSGGAANLKLRSQVKPKKESKNEERDAKEKVKIKKDDKPRAKEKEAERDKAKVDKAKAKPSWEEELFNYKYSLRMPVKLINIARPTNWPKSSGGASSLPDLDRMETDSDLLNGIGRPKTPKKKNKDESRYSNSKEFKESVKHLKETFDKKIEEKNQATSGLHQLMMEKKIKTIPKSSDGPELLPTPSLDSFRSKLSCSLTPKKESKRGKANSRVDDEDEKDEVVEDSLIGYFRKETVDVFKEVFEKHKMPNQFATVILESRTRTQTKELKHHATLKQVFGCDRPASAPPVPDTKDAGAVPSSQDGGDSKDDAAAPPLVQKNASTNGAVLKPWHKSFAKIKFLMGDEGVVSRGGSDKDSKDYEEEVDDFVVGGEEDAKDAGEIELIERVVMKKKSRTGRRKCRSSGFDYIRKRKKIKKEDDDEVNEEKEKKKIAVSVRPTPESIEDIQNEIKSWVVNKGIGETVLHKAARLGYLDISSYCLEKLNCSPSPTDNAGYTPLHEACTRGHLKIAKMLLKYGADVSASAKGGIRPLHEAVESGDVELVRLLLSYGADPLLSTYGGQTPLSLVKENQDNLKEFLLLYVADIQGTPSKPWQFGGVDDFDRETNGYDTLREPPSPSYEELETLEFEMSDSPLPSLYRFKDDYDLWVRCSDLPVRVRDAITKRGSAQDTVASPYVVRKIGPAQYDEHVECAMLLENKRRPKSKSNKSDLITMVKYNEKLLACLNIQKLSMTFS